MYATAHPFYRALQGSFADAIVRQVPVAVSVQGTPIPLTLTDDGATGRMAGISVLTQVSRSGDGCCVEWVTTITNTGDAPISSIEIVPFIMEFDLGDEKDLPRVRHLSGSWHFDALYPPRAFRLHEEAFVTHDHARPLRIGGANSGIHSPILQVGLGAPLRAGFFIGMEWSGGWGITAGFSEMSFKGEPRPLFTVSGRADLGPLDLEPGASSRVPAVHLGAAAITDWRELDQLQRRRLRELMPSSPLDSPLPVSYDSWFGRYERFDIATLMEDATAAARIGVEVFCLDACWYRSDSVHDGLGNWLTPDPGRFPNGEQDILMLADHVRRSGMKFGLWHLIQLAAPFSDVVRTRPELFRKPAHGNLRAANEKSFGVLAESTMTSFGGLMLALERADGVEYALEILEYWIQHWGVEWFRFESVPADGLAYNDGYNCVLETLVQRHPELYLEICNGGGQRLDLNSIRRTHGNWLSDHTSSPEITRFNQTGASRFWPSRMTNMAVPALAGGGDKQATTYQVMSRMTGVLSFTGALADWSDDAIRQVRTVVDAYKQIRHVIDEDAYFPLPQPTSAEDWDAVLFSDPGREETILFAFRLSGPGAQRIDVPWLTRPKASIIVSATQGAEAVPEEGAVTVMLPPRSAGLWRLTDEKASDKLAQAFALPSCPLSG